MWSASCSIPRRGFEFLFFLQPYLVCCKTLLSCIFPYYMHLFIDPQLPRKLVNLSKNPNFAPISCMMALVAICR
ncbi:hypothetical protein BCR34DRAFT_553360 [Clohesyomyces aquaticus]|uniref:Uncharacterized protein n=1 Tax=Clohesyomyces aquaticus TaxID=1231657 RepID=A0A1Y2A883_9PLEO|nr:hypothetical protein BCR34DRAFT_553360 [Clohesyomyces aquaticus]